MKKYIFTISLFLSLKAYPCAKSILESENVSKEQSKEKVSEILSHANEEIMIRIQYNEVACSILSDDSVHDKETKFSFAERVNDMTFESFLKKRPIKKDMKHKRIYERSFEQKKDDYIKHTNIFIKANIITWYIISNSLKNFEYSEDLLIRIHEEVLEAHSTSGAELQGMAPDNVALGFIRDEAYTSLVILDAFRYLNNEVYHVSLASPECLDVLDTHDDQKYSFLKTAAINGLPNYEEPCEPIALERKKTSTDFIFPEEKFNYKGNSYRHIREFIFQMIKDERVPELSIPFAKQFFITKADVNISKEYENFIKKNCTTSENSKSSYLPSQFKDGRSIKQKGKKTKSKNFSEQQKVSAAISQNKSIESNLLSPKETLSDQDIKTNASSINDHSETGNYQETNTENEKKERAEKIINPIDTIVEKPKSSKQNNSDKRSAPIESKAVKSHTQKRDRAAKQESEEEFQVQNSSLRDEKETLFYRQLLGPHSQNRTLSWNNMISQLKKFGWRFANSKGGSAVTFHPPEWYLESQFAERFSKKFVVHQSHKPSKSPMNSYIFDYLHSGLRSIGFDTLF